MDPNPSATVSFTISLSAASEKTITVEYATADDSAEEGVDYTGIFGTLTFTAGTTMLFVGVTALQDSLGESNETYFVNISSAINAAISQSSPIGTITDDD